MAKMFSESGSAPLGNSDTPDGKKNRRPYMAFSSAPPGNSDTPDVGSVEKKTPASQIGITYDDELLYIRGMKDEFKVCADNWDKDDPDRIQANRGYIEALAMELNLLDRLQGTQPKRKKAFSSGVLKPHVK